MSGSEQYSTTHVLMTFVIVSRIYTLQEEVTMAESAAALAESLLSF